MRLALLVAALAALVVTGCGSDEEVEAGDGATTTGGDSVSEDGLKLSVAARPEPPVSGQGVAWLLTLSNAGDEALTLTFSSGQRGDVVLLDGDEEVYRWSAERAFTQVVEEVEVAAGSSETFTLEDPAFAVPAGDYMLSATVTSDPAPPPVEQDLTVVDE